ncbi:hypothetical protein [Pedobacter caeni]|uniref:Uncharacterized protein n=1 Tax=Pedobacter caeni TaxID=288992 RepID=A0A1M5JLT1_9SPHI|nr:hypothetical protein [Pedobacter caeni]SHG41220.1 hypothetical protein SAMN04488522_105406 [Pedobacter caeni]
MKNKSLFISTIVFFLLVCGNYWLDDFFKKHELPLLFVAYASLLIIVFIVLLISLLFQVKRLFRESSWSKSRLFLIGTMTFTLFFTVWSSFGFLNLKKVRSRNVLIARTEDSSHGMSVLKLKENKHFIYRSTCSGGSRVMGTYSIVADTIRFSGFDRKNGLPNFKYGIIKIAKALNSKVNTEVISLYIDDNHAAKRPLMVMLNNAIHLRD